MAGKFELRKSSSGQYYFNLKAANGEPLLSSKMYISKGGAENGIRSVRENVVGKCQLALDGPTGRRTKRSLIAA